jgi:manganese/iron transport system substrate-binding protein
MPMRQLSKPRLKRLSRRSANASVRSPKSEGAFSYLARDFGLKELYLWPINADAQGTPQQIRKVIDLVREHKIPAVFSESTVSPDPAQQVARETGSTYGGVLYVDSISDETGPVPTYLDLLRVTTETIAAGLTE